MMPITTTDLALYLKDCERIGRKPTLADWMAVETQNMSSAVARPYEAEMIALWGDLDRARFKTR